MAIPDRLKGSAQLESDLTVLNAMQKRAMVLASCYIRCGLSKKAAKKVLKKVSRDLVEAIWSVDESVYKSTDYYYAMFDFDGTFQNLHDAYMRLDYSDFMECDDKALQIVANVEKQYGGGKHGK